MSDKEITYSADPAIFESVTRQYLSSDKHSKKTLIEYGVQVSIELEKMRVMLNQYIEKFGKLRSEINLANQFLNIKSWNNDQIANVLEQDFGVTTASNLIRKTKNKTNSRRSVKGGKAPKKIDKPTKSELVEFKNKWSAEYYRINAVKTDRGWKKAAQNHYEISDKTLNNIIDSK